MSNLAILPGMRRKIRHNRPKYRKKTREDEFSACIRAKNVQYRKDPMLRVRLMQP